jgi:hypothetical protein
MREQIASLMKQAGTDTSGKWMGVEHAEKFAKLIAEECMRLNSKELSITAIERLLPLYQEQFGVKE